MVPCAPRDTGHDVALHDAVIVKISVPIINISCGSKEDNG